MGEQGLEGPEASSFWGGASCPSVGPCPGPGTAPNPEGQGCGEQQYDDACNANNLTGCLRM